MNIWESLIGAPPQGPEETQRIAQQLRRNAEFGLLGQLTGDKVLGPAGASMRESSFKKAGLLQGSRQKKLEAEQKAELARLQRELSKGYYDQVAQQHAENLQYKKDRDPVADQLARDLAQMKVSSSGGIDAADMWRYRQNLGRDIEKAKIPEMRTDIAKVDAALAELEEGAGVPGVGWGKFNMSDEARAFRGKLAPIKNVLLHARSGAAVTENELKRFEEELLGEGIFASDADFRRSWQSLKDKIDAKERAILQSYDPIVVDYYLSESSMVPGSGRDATTVSGPAYLMNDPNAMEGRRSPEEMEKAYGLSK